MADYFHPDAMDAALDEISGRVDRLVILSAYPTNYAQVGLYTLGYKDAPAISGPSNRDAGGRELVVATFTDGVTIASGTGLFFALVDDAADVRLVVGRLCRPTTLVGGQALVLDEDIRVGIPAAADMA